jgi:excisionase family DNA binding protein
MKIRTPTGSKASSKTPPKRFHSVATVARQLEVSEKSVRRFIKRRLLRAYKIGGKIRISEDDLRSFILACRLLKSDIQVE